MLRGAVISAALILAACAAPSTPAQHESQPHIPPPKFSGGDAQACGVRGISPDICEPNEFCRRTIGDICGAADAPGVCSPIPEMCTMDYSPVCGCDGQTYSNECVANSKGVSAASAGECKP